MTDNQAVMFLGTGSDVGKSITATAFCRILKNRGRTVAPFKAQNMSNNSFVTAEGGEIGRAQVAQAEACGLPPSVHMNPILLKPNTDLGSQVVVQGRVLDNLTAREYYDRKADLKQLVMESYQILRRRFDTIVLEGAGSCCEVNLRAHDLVNFETAFMANAPVILVADIDRGGVFAQIVGSLEIIAKEERDRIAGFIINKFRGDPELFRDGVQYIEERTGKPVFGVVPYLPDCRIDTEDSMSLEKKENAGGTPQNKVRIGVVKLPHLSNFTDLEVLDSDPDVLLNWLIQPTDLSIYDALILPGSKNSIGDMQWLADQGWVEALNDYAARQAGCLVGICGGYQMLGKEIVDPHRVEGFAGSIPGVGLLDVATELEPTKIVRLARGTDTLFGADVRGYEIHMGVSRLQSGLQPFAELDSGPDGAVNPTGNVMGTYLHGIFDSAGFRTRFIEHLASRNNRKISYGRHRQDYWEEKEGNYDRLAAHFEQHVDIETILAVMNRFKTPPAYPG